MMASVNPSFSPHPGMQQHPNLPPGHPMAMAHAGSQPGAQQGGMPQHLAHMGVSGPGPQVNPNVMMAGGMPPGGPNAHAMQHLNPQQAQMFAQQQQMANNQMFANPQMAHLQQQRMQQIQQQQRMMMANQQAVYGGGGMPMNMAMNAAQMAAMRQRAMHGGPHGPTPHTQAMMAQQLAIQQQQQQQAANSQMGHGQNPNQPGQMNPQMHAQQQAQLAALAASQAQQHAQVAAQQHPPVSAPQPSPSPSQPQMQTPQQPQAGPPPNVSQPGQSPAQVSSAQQPNQPAPQAQQPPTAQNQPQPNPMAVQAAHQQQQQLAAGLMQQQKREGMKGHCLLKLMQFGEHLSGFPGARSKDDISYWTEFVMRFFSPKGIFRHAIHVIDGEDGNDKQYEIPYSALARYFHTYFDSGVKNMQLVMDKGTMDKPLPGDRHFIENSKSSLVYWFEEGSHVVATGTIRCQFDAEQRIELFEFLCNGYEEYISRSLVIKAAKPAHNWVKEWHKVNSQDNKQSPEMSKKGKARQMKSPQNPPPDLDLPPSAVKQNVGVTEAVNQFLEVVEIMGQMNPLFDLFHTNHGLGPYQALEQYVSEVNTNVPNVNGQAMPQGGPRTPGFGQFPMHASPHAAHLQLPGSPHVGSPAAGGVMQAPGMHPSQSQQGTSSGVPSADTSPAGTKRRRPSGVKVEDEMGTPASAPTPNAGPQVNGVQNKTKPPTPRMQKKQKINQTS